MGSLVGVSSNSWQWQPDYRVLKKTDRVLRHKWDYLNDMAVVDPRPSKPPVTNLSRLRANVEEICVSGRKLLET